MANLLTLKATLYGIKPPIWRRVAVPDTLTFWEFHFVMQILFDWENSHLFEFRTGRGTPFDFLTGSPPVMPGDEDNMPEWQQDPRTVLLTEVLDAPKAKLTYTYDFGDNWEHQIVVETVTPLAPDAPLPPVRCLAGRRAAPPEDMGGIWGYAELLDALAQKAAGTRKRLPSEYADFAKLDPEEFDLDGLNQELARLDEIAAQHDAYLAQIQARYQQQQPARAPAPYEAPLDINALLSAMAANLAKPLRGSIPKKPKP